MQQKILLKCCKVFLMSKLYFYVWTIKKKILYKWVVWNRLYSENQTTAKTRSNNQQEIHFDLGILVSSFEKTRLHPMMLILHLTATLLHYSMFEVAYLHLWRLDVTCLKPYCYIRKAEGLDTSSLEVNPLKLSSAIFSTAGWYFYYKAAPSHWQIMFRNFVKVKKTCTITYYTWNLSKMCH